MLLPALSVQTRLAAIPEKADTLTFWLGGTTNIVGVPPALNAAFIAVFKDVSVNAAVVLVEVAVLTAEPGGDAGAAGEPVPTEVQLVLIQVCKEAIKGAVLDALVTGAMLPRIANSMSRFSS